MNSRGTKKTLFIASADFTSWHWGTCRDIYMLMNICQKNQPAVAHGKKKRRKVNEKQISKNVL